MKAARPHLKQLQQQVKVLSSEKDSGNSQSGQSPLSPDSFQWITREQTFVMVYLVCSCKASAYITVGSIFTLVSEKFVFVL